jgi:hypothetical protein
MPTVFLSEDISIDSGELGQDEPLTALIEAHLALEGGHFHGEL